MLFITVDRRGFEIFTPRALDPIIGSLLDGDALGCGDMNTVPHFSPDSFEIGVRSFLLCELFIAARPGAICIIDEPGCISLALGAGPCALAANGHCSLPFCPLYKDPALDRRVYLTHPIRPGEHG